MRFFEMNIIIKSRVFITVVSGVGDSWLVSIREKKNGWNERDDSIASIGLLTNVSAQQ